MEMGNSTETQNDIVLKLATHLIANVATGSNLVFSPTSINVLLCLIAAGSSCVAKQGILSLLMMSSSDHLNAVLDKTLAVTLVNDTERSDLQLFMTNGAWIDKSLSLKPSFKKLLENSYKVTCNQVDFASKPGEVINEVNRWAKDNSNGVIKQILSHKSVETIRGSTLILENAVYIKGSWSKRLVSHRGDNEDFHLLDGTSVKVPYMTNSEDQYLEDYDNFQVLRLPYVEDQRQFSMYIYLPNDKDGLPSLLEKIGFKPGFIDNHIPHHRVSVGAFGIPKFKFSFEFEASYVLKDLGLTSPLTRGGSFD